MATLVMIVGLTLTLGIFVVTGVLAENFPRRSGGRPGIAP